MPKLKSLLYSTMLMSVFAVFSIACGNDGTKGEGGGTDTCAEGSCDAGTGTDTATAEMDAGEPGTGTDTATAEMDAGEPIHYEDDQ